MRSTMTNHEDWKNQKPAVWLTEYPSVIINDQSGVDWCVKNDAHIIILDMIGIICKYRSNIELTCSKHISKKRIVDIKPWRGTVNGLE
jgi:hypothetical protein